MATLPIRHYPEPILKRPAARVERVTAKIEKNISDMIETMRRLPRCVGLAAPQVGIPLAIAVLDVSKHPKTTLAHGLLVLVNPLLIHGEGHRLIREGCASVPDYTGNVERFEHVRISYGDRRGQSQELVSEGFEAVAIQHELDHLSGMLFLDRLLPHHLFQRKNFA